MNGLKSQLLLRRISLKINQLPMNKVYRVCFLLLWIPSAICADDLETGLTKLAQELAIAASKSSGKKISVVDFTDLQGNTSELGRYIAEQLSVSLVGSAKDFSVMDRANLKSVLEEHKLTASGLVNPENARKLGQFSGVDAIVLGSITPFEQSFSITAKIISTETTQVLGAGRIRADRTKDLTELWTNPPAKLSNEKNTPLNPEVNSKEKEAVSAEEKSAATLAALLEVRKNSTTVGNFLVKVESLRETRQNSRYGTVTLAIVNQSAEPQWVRIDHEKGYYSSLTNRVGSVFECDNSNWISGILAGSGDYTVIEPKSSIIVTLRHMVVREGDPTLRPCRLEFILRSAINTDGSRVKGEKANNILVEIQ